MTAFLLYLLKVTLCSGVLFLYYYVALRNRLFHQWNRFYLLATVVLSLLLPLCRFTIFQDNPAGDDGLQWLRSFQQADHTLQEFVVRTQNGLSQEQWLLLFYLLGCAFFLLPFTRSLYRIAAAIKSHSVRTVNRVKLVETELQGTPFSFFHFIFWNRKIPLSSEAGQQIFRHEMVHVREHHSIDKAFLQVALLFFWCNPFFWLIRREVHNIHEFIADKKAVGEQNTSALAALLLQTVFPTHYSTFTNSFFQTPIKRRLMMLSKKQSLSYAGRILVLPVIAVLSLAFTVRTKPSSGSTEVAASLRPGQPVTDTVPRKEMHSVNVNKNDKDRTITITYKDGTTKSYSMEEAQKEGLIAKEQAPNDAGAAKPAAPKPLFIIDGKEFTGDVNSIDPTSISSVNVLKNEAATAKYGKKGENGVVEIVLKKEGATSALNDASIVFEKAEMAASIDQQTWRRFLEQNTAPVIDEVSKQAPSGKYTVNVRFIVNKDGSLSDFRALNDPGYGMAAKVLEMMKLAPKWEPAKQNGRLVRSYHTQPITFVITDGKATN